MASYVIGLTGGIGSGKSAVADAFARRGIDVTDTDRIAHALTAPGQPGLLAIVDAFGTGVLQHDGSLDRSRLRQHVFADVAARERLEAILHPMIRAEAAAAVSRWTSPYGLLVVPLLLERGGHRNLIRRVLVVDCPEDLQVARVMARNSITEDEVRAIMAAQLPRAARLARADDVIDNSGSLAALEPVIEAFDLRYRQLAVGANHDDRA